uniref:Relaxin 3 n=1 Tax=Callorhinchus milii TaxID=7868 RepID=V9LCU5_CALMI
MKCLVCVLTVGMFLSSLPGSVLSQTNKGTGYGVKLCGRDFIRAIIYTCGGSRWRRLSDDQDYVPSQTAADKDTESMKTFQDMFANDGFQKPDLPFGQQPLKDTPYNDGEFGQQIPNALSQYIQQNEEGIEKNQEVENFPWAKSLRRKRQEPLGLAVMCCKWGCTKNEIRALC